MATSSKQNGDFAYLAKFKFADTPMYPYTRYVGIPEYLYSWTKMPARATMNLQVDTDMTHTLVDTTLTLDRIIEESYMKMHRMHRYDSTTEQSESDTGEVFYS